ncbi:STAS domain-containing protein [Sphingobacterium deserti]|uniref:Positive regulator of sigma-B n=1 Tax=Sphingobacterium deserti TaxID=1229276 RepID=A0A0B8T5Y9_9SPHI|nr:STAS domain-containing protein [Sphingobacterium deserti]KGE13179.1 positive regulator of sigma-B [Sphingobacterium deserti]
MEIVQVLKKRKQNVLKLWLDKQAHDAALNGNPFDEGEINDYVEKLVDTFVDSIENSNIDDIKSADFDAVIELLREVSFKRARQGFSPRETGLFIFSLKESILEVLSDDLKKSKEAIPFIITLSRLMDSLATVTFETFIEGREDVINRQTDEISEISTPVIKVWDGILALPIIGTLDSSRTQTVLENLLQEIVETGSSVAILDISGVPTVDSLVAQHLLKAVSATRLMGAECIISGIRPEIAQTIVYLGIDLSQIVTKSTLASALQHAFRILNLAVRNNDTTKTIKK